jgi:dehydrogenase/reductase SDR family member 7B
MKDRVVVITGASSGIGKALAEEFAAKGSKVVLAARSIDKLESTRQALSAAGVSVLTVPCDVTIENDCRNLVEKAVAEFGTIHVLINNAGISMRALFADLDLNVLRQIMDTNFWGAVYCTRFAMPYLLANKGSLVGISSIAGKKGLPGRTGYSASKFALEGFLETLRTENLKKNLHVLVACPGFTSSNIRSKALGKDGSVQGESPRNEQKMMQPGEVASRIYSAVVHRKRDLILSTDGKLTVWLNKFFPAWMDKMVYNHMAKEPDSPF